MAAGRLPDAEAEFRSILSANKDYIPAHIGLATVYRRQHQYPQAIAESTHILVAEPKAFNALLNAAYHFTKAVIWICPPRFQCFFAGSAWPARGILLPGTLTSTKNDMIRPSPIYEKCWILLLTAVMARLI